MCHVVGGESTLMDESILPLKTPYPLRGGFERKHFESGIICRSNLFEHPTFTVHALSLPSDTAHMIYTL
jgi:hypothetical protein